MTPMLTNSLENVNRLLGIYRLDEQANSKPLAKTCIYQFHCINGVTSSGAKGSHFLLDVDEEDLSWKLHSPEQRFSTNFVHA
jgi:hypothetical protein